MPPDEQQVRLAHAHLDVDAAQDYVKYLAICVVAGALNGTGDG
jgi:hypothetical protein